MASMLSQADDAIDIIWKIAVLIILLYIVFGILLPVLSHIP